MERRRPTVDDMTCSDDAYVLGEVGRVEVVLLRGTKLCRPNVGTLGALAMLREWAE